MKIYTVEQINNYIKNMLGTDPLLTSVSVTGEVSNLKYHPSGHIYFKIKDKGNVLSAVMFAGNRAGLNFKLADGVQIVASGNIAVYERDGIYQLYARKITKAGMGELYERFLALKKELEDMGMFDPIYKKPIPRIAGKVGIITASSGAALQDIMNIAKRRNPYVSLFLYPAIVQGEYAVDSLCTGLKRMDEYGVDVIIIGRGGGSIEDLWAFNDEKVARAIFACNTPVISAVGHETDFTIADFVADMRAPTPSAAAELAVCDINEIYGRITAQLNALNRAMHNHVENVRMKLSMYAVRLNGLSPAKVIADRKQQIDNIRMTLDRDIWDKLTQYRQRLNLLAARLSADSPLNRLSMGYSYVTDEEDRAVTSVDGLNEGDLLKINVADGVIDAQIINKKRIDRQVWQ